MKILETRDGVHLPPWHPTHLEHIPHTEKAGLDYSRIDDRPQVKHIRNRSRYDRTVYVGRGEHSPLGNPFRMVGGASGRAQSIKKYRAWLWTKITSGDSRVMQALDALTADTVLLCYCHPKDCHADVISKAWKWLQRPEGKAFRVRNL